MIMSMNLDQAICLFGLLPHLNVNTKYDMQSDFYKEQKLNWTVFGLLLASTTLKELYKIFWKTWNQSISHDH